MSRRIGARSSISVLSAPGVFSVSEVAQYQRLGQWPRAWAAWGGTWNPADKDADITLSGGDLTWTAGAAGSVRGTTGFSSGKYRFDFNVTFDGNAGRLVGAGIATASASLASHPGADAGAIAVLTGAIVTGVQVAVIVHNGAALGVLPADATTYGVAADIDRGQVWFRADAAVVGPFALADYGLSGVTLYPIGGSNGGSQSSAANFSGPFA